MKTFIEIDTKTFVRFWLVVIGFALAALAIYSARHALIIVATAFFLALVLNIPVAIIAKKLPGKSRVGATAIAYVAVVVALAAVIFLVVPPIVQQTAKFIQTVPTLVDNAGTQWNGLKGLVDEYNLQPQIDNAVNSIKESTSSWASSVGGTVIGGVGSFFSFLASLFLVLVLAFLMLIEAPMWMSRIWGLYSNKKKMEDHKRILNRLYNVVAGYVTGQLTVSALGATFAALAVAIISFIFPAVPISLALPAAAATFTFSLIPMFGSTIGALLIIVLLAFNSVPAAIAYAIFFVVYQQIENNFLSPRIQAKRNDLSALIILASITIGLYLFGIAGGIIAIPIAGSIRILLEEYLAYTKKQRAVKAPTAK